MTNEELLIEQIRLESSLGKLIEKQTGVQSIGKRYINLFTLGAVPGLLMGSLMDAAYLIRNNQFIADHGQSMFPKYPRTMRFANVVSCGFLTALVAGFALERIMEQSTDLKEETTRGRLNHVEKLLKERGIKIEDKGRLFDSLPPSRF